MRKDVKHGDDRYLLLCFNIGIYTDQSKNIQGFLTHTHLSIPLLPPSHSLGLFGRECVHRHSTLLPASPKSPSHLPHLDKQIEAGYIVNIQGSGKFTTKCVY